MNKTSTHEDTNKLLTKTNIPKSLLLDSHININFNNNNFIAPSDNFVVLDEYNIAPPESSSGLFKKTKQWITQKLKYSFL